MANELSQFKEDCLMYASYLPEIEVDGKLTNRYEDYDITVLADTYCKALDEDDEFNKSVYLSAIILRFWSKISKTYEAVKTCGYEYDDCLDNLYYCISTACQYRAWQDPEKHTNAQACINQVISVRGVPEMVYKAGFQKNERPLYILDESVDDDTESSKLDTIASKHIGAAQDEHVFDFVQYLIYKQKVVEAILADIISYEDCEKVEQKTIKEIGEDGKEYKYTQVNRSFWPFQLVNKKLNEIDDNFVNYFSSTYVIKDEVLKSAIEDIKKANNNKRYKFLESLQTLNANF